MEAVEGSHDADDRVGHGEDHEDHEDRVDHGEAHVAHVAHVAHEDHEVHEGENEDENADVVVEEREGTDEMRFVMM